MKASSPFIAALPCKIGRPSASKISLVLIFIPFLSTSVLLNNPSLVVVIRVPVESKIVGFPSASSTGI